MNTLNIGDTIEILDISKDNKIKSGIWLDVMDNFIGSRGTIIKKFKDYIVTSITSYWYPTSAIAKIKISSPNDKKISSKEITSKDIVDSIVDQVNGVKKPVKKSTKNKIKSTKKK